MVRLWLKNWEIWKARLARILNIHWLTVETLRGFYRFCFYGRPGVIRIRSMIIYEQKWTKRSKHEHNFLMCSNLPRFAAANCSGWNEYHLKRSKLWDIQISTQTEEATKCSAPSSTPYRKKWRKGFAWLQHFKCTVHITFKCTGHIRIKCTVCITLKCTSCSGIKCTPVNQCQHGWGRSFRMVANGLTM